jgi:hypothetical protein
MKIAYMLFGGWIAVSAITAGAWQGIKTKPSKGRSETALSPSRTPPPAAPGMRPADTSFLSRKVSSIPAGSAGKYMGTLEGVRCFNCAPDQVHLNLGDSLSRESGIIALRIEVWNAIERPVKDRRMYDMGNRCFYFGHDKVDTVFVGGDWTEIRVQDVPCYPYLRRTLRTSLAGQRMNAAVAGPVAATADPAETPAETPARPNPGPSAPTPTPAEHPPEDIFPAP